MGQEALNLVLSAHGWEGINYGLQAPEGRRLYWQRRLKPICSLRGREQAFWKVPATPGHVAEQLLVASLDLCLISDISVFMG